MQAMTVPWEDVLCRLIPRDRWNYEENRPLISAFQASGRVLSVWHLEQLASAGAAVSDLQIESLAATGEAHLRVRDFVEAGVNCSSPDFDPRVEWRTSDEYVHPTWRRWSESHVQVEATHGKPTFPHDYRVRLTFLCFGLQAPASS